VSTRPNYSCADCGVDTDRIDEYSYMVQDRVWAASLRRHRRYGGVGSTYDLLCVGCLEKRLGRELVPADFKLVPLTTRPSHQRSARLRARLRP
jgi:hypothetical protein